MSRPSLLSRIWANFKKSLVISRTKDKYIGLDEFGNKYFEREEDNVNSLKRKRKIVPLNPDLTIVPKVPVEWMTWLQGRRIEPPSPEEIEENRIATMKTLARAAKLQEKDQLDKLETSGKPPISSQTNFPLRSDLEQTPGEKN